MSTVGLRLREIRKNAGYSLRKAATLADIDVAILSKVERGERKLNKELIIRLSEIYNISPDSLLIDFFSQRIIYELVNEEFGLEVLKVAEERIRSNYEKKLKN
jgi:transcriptional regulator with XRE-family HTH domain